MNQFISFSYFRSANSFRVRIALYHKGLEFEYKAVDILSNERMNNAELISARPNGKIPCLIHNGKVIAQSYAIVEYLDNSFPNPPLFPADSYERAMVQRVCQDINSDISPMHNLNVLKELNKWFDADQEKQFEWSRYWIGMGLENLERLVSSTCGKYCFGDDITAADIFLVPQVNRAFRFGVEVNNYPSVNKIYQNCMVLESFKKAAPENQPDTPGNYFGESAT